MEYRQLGNSGLRVPVLSFGTATFGGGNDWFKAWGSTQVEEASRMVNLCLDAGVNFFDTANVYSAGASEQILGKAISGLRDKVLISTKAVFPTSSDINDFGSSRINLRKSCEESLKRLGTDHIDVYHLHGFDANTPMEETIRALDDLIQSGKIRYIACSNYSSWHLMKSLSISERYGWSKFVAHQVYYSLLDRDFELDLMPVGIDQNIGSIIWSPLSAGKLSGKYNRRSGFPADARIAQGGSPVLEDDNQDRLYKIVDVLEEVAGQTEKSVAQVSLNWLLKRPTVSNIIIGARNEEQLKHNLGAVGWSLTIEQVKKLDAASEVPRVYPYWHQKQFPLLNSTVDLYKV
ncbi:aldo/keto reductase [Dyadobacter subterraneus]|uniref:Aldo/keto reductase n=1 Tax=Dyadobacter subterraneus TaxID=2773304 RepID=A0ABR9WC42_9BACT|nr:aldo/keto reductase [Dyadobacter subterraneus]MBE9461931.1 aldo/keto reductase [Dyadobacter subterraneus]